METFITNLHYVKYVGWLFWIFWRNVPKWTCCAIYMVLIMVAYLSEVHRPRELNCPSCGSINRICPIFTENVQENHRKLLLLLPTWFRCTIVRHGFVVCLPSTSFESNLSAVDEAFGYFCKGIVLKFKKVG